MGKVGSYDTWSNAEPSRSNITVFEGSAVPLVLDISVSTGVLVPVCVSARLLVDGRGLRVGGTGGRRPSESRV